MKSSTLKPYSNNPRRHSPDDVANLARSIQEFGWTNPVLVDEDMMILAGHCRIMAADKMKQDTVPVIVLDGLTAAQKRAYVIADNQLTLNGEWDLEILSNEVFQLSEDDFDLSVLGMDEAIQSGQFEVGGEGGEDEPAPEKFMLLVNCETRSGMFELQRELLERGLAVTIKQ